MQHVDIRKLPAVAQEKRRRQVIGLRQDGMTYAAVAAQEAEVQALIRRQTPDALEPRGGAGVDLVALSGLPGGAHDGDLPSALGLHRKEATAASL